MANELNVQGFALGPFATNCYVTWREGSTRCWIIDAGYMPGELIRFVQQRRLQPQRVLLTHAHCDHIAGLDEIRDAFDNLPACIHVLEEQWLTDADLNLSAPYGLPRTVRPAEGFVAERDVLELDGLTFEVLHVPGHSPGSVAFYCKEQAIAFSGDALFRDSIGRTDFPNADHNTLLQSIREKLLTLPDETQILPGHMDPTTIGREKRFNPFVGESA